MRNVLEYLENTKAANPKKVAIIDEVGQCTYEELLERSRSIGSALIDKVTSTMPIVVYLEKGIAAITSFFGILYAGGCYTLLNTDLPMARLGQIHKVLQASFVITDRDHKEAIRELFQEKEILLVEDLVKAPMNSKKLALVRGRAIDSDPLYINFTSGSTGVPKGVVISHRSVIDFIDVFTKLFTVTGKDVIGNQAPFDFDVSVKDIYSAICTGATLVVIPKALFSRPAELLDFICEHKVTTMIWAVSALCLVTTFHGLDYKVPYSVNKILFSGEVMPLKHLKIWMEHLPQAEFINVYGPTEITCNCTYYRIRRDMDYEHGIPIGQAFPNEQVFLLDEENKLLVDPGLSGEICVKGTALALGYYNAPGQTESHFIQNPLHSRYYDRIYRTGDLGQLDQEGNLYFLGRKDFQIKHMGHRIELEEIEQAMMEITGLQRACCVFDEGKSKLYGFYVGALEKKEVHHSLKEKLPVFMVPGALIQVLQMPLTKNGKIDRKALLAHVGRRKHE